MICLELTNIKVLFRDILVALAMLFSFTFLQYSPPAEVESSLVVPKNIPFAIQ